jgi:hypothetical protein
VPFRRFGQAELGGIMSGDILGCSCGGLAIFFFGWCLWYLRKSGAPRRREIEQAFADD